MKRNVPLSIEISLPTAARIHGIAYVVGPRRLEVTIVQELPLGEYVNIAVSADDAHASGEAIISTVAQTSSGEFRHELDLIRVDARYTEAA